MGSWCKAHLYVLPSIMSYPMISWALYCSQDEYSFTPVINQWRKDQISDREFKGPLQCYDTEKRQDNNLEPDLLSFVLVIVTIELRDAILWILALDFWEYNDKWTRKSILLKQRMNFDRQKTIKIKKNLWN